MKNDSGIPNIRCKIATLVLTASALAAQAQTYSIDWTTIDSGGGTSTGGVFTVTGTIGQADAGRMSGCEFTIEGGFWGIVVAIPFPGARLLSIELTNDLVKVSWPAPSPGWVLTATNRLTDAGSPLWPQVPLDHYQTNCGRIFILTAPQPMQSRYYQLRKPGP